LDDGKVVVFHVILELSSNLVRFSLDSPEKAFRSPGKDKGVAEADLVQVICWVSPVADLIWRLRRVVVVPVIVFDDQRICQLPPAFEEYVLRVFYLQDLAGFR